MHSVTRKRQQQTTDPLLASSSSFSYLFLDSYQIFPWLPIHRTGGGVDTCRRRIIPNYLTIFSFLFFSLFLSFFSTVDYCCSARAILLKLEQGRLYSFSCDKWIHACLGAMRTARSWRENRERKEKHSSHLSVYRERVFLLLSIFIHPVAECRGSCFVCACGGRLFHTL